MRRSTTFDRISDRQFLVGDKLISRRLGLEPYMFDRLDMYWARVEVTDEGLQASLSYCIERDSKSGVYYLSFQYGPAKLDDVYMRRAILRKWESSDEKRLADRWWNQLVEGGYFEMGAIVSQNTAQCPTCGCCFEIGTVHPHKFHDREPWYHHAKMGAVIKTLNLKTTWSSGFNLKAPSLEELGKRVPAIVGRPDSTVGEAWELLVDTYGEFLYKLPEGVTRGS